MIFEEHRRVRDGEECPTVNHERTAMGALVDLMIYEVGYGGQITMAIPDQIRVRTAVMGCVDTTIFGGSEKEMKPLLLAAHYFLSSFDAGKMMGDRAFRQLQQIAGEKGVNAFLLTNLGPMLANRELAKASMLVAVGITDPEELRAAMKLASEDLAPVLELREENPEVPLQEILQLVRQ